jgi:hypothetical protein
MWRGAFLALRQSLFGPLPKKTKRAAPQLSTAFRFVWQYRAAQGAGPRKSCQREQRRQYPAQRHNAGMGAASRLAKPLRAIVQAKASQATSRA